MPAKTNIDLIRELMIAVAVFEEREETFHRDLARSDAAHGETTKVAAQLNTRITVLEENSPK